MKYALGWIAAICGALFCVGVLSGIAETQAQDALAPARDAMHIGLETCGDRAGTLVVVLDNEARPRVRLHFVFTNELVAWEGLPAPQGKVPVIVVPARCQP